MRILGVDPGLRATGFGVVESRGAHLAYVASGVIRVPAGELSLRLKAIFDGLAEVIRTYSPQCAAIERVFVNVNPASTLLLGQARGAAITALAAGGLPVAEYAALQIKQAVVGTGRAGKTQVQHMVVRLCWRCPARRRPMRPMRWPARCAMPTAAQPAACWRRRPPTGQRRPPATGRRSPPTVERCSPQTVGRCSPRARASPRPRRCAPPRPWRGCRCGAGGWCRPEPTAQIPS